MVNVIKLSYRTLTNRNKKGTLIDLLKDTQIWWIRNAFLMTGQDGEPMSA